MGAAVSFAQRLIVWHKDHGRHDLPWQNNRDPYRIWLSEIMLQQTQVATVIPYYQRFLARFPDIVTLAAAPVDGVMTLWSGLGYYARARNLQRAAQVVVREHGGEFPRDMEAINALPGIGRSTAAAIAVFAFGKRAAILDGNVKRVLARAYGIAGFPGERLIENQLWHLAEQLLPRQNVATYTQALMDLGATLCTRSKPRCERCPLQKICVARREGRCTELPTARAKRALPQRISRVMILQRGNQVLLGRRPPAGIWGGLLSLPELSGKEDARAFAARYYACKLSKIESLAPLKHNFTHFGLKLQPLLCEVTGSKPVLQQDASVWFDLARIDNAPLPTPIRKILRRLTQAAKSLTSADHAA